MPLRTFIGLGAAALGAGAGALLIWDQALREPRDHRRERAEAITGGLARNGQELIEHYGCAGCHDIPGIRQRGGSVGPPLSGIGARVYIGGKLANRPDNLMRWIQDPQRVEPGTAMPDLGVSPAEARDIAAFLYTVA
jgi:cytochrome c